VAPHASHRQLFESHLRRLPVDARGHLAGVADDPELSALCFDPSPEVVRRILENPRAGLVQARLIAAHHGNAAGLEALAVRADFLRDPEVQRLLLRNVQSPGHVIRRLLGSRRLQEVYHLCRSHEVPERTRGLARDLLRARFAQASPEERVELVVRTQGSALPLLTGLSLDGKAAALLCRRISSAVSFQLVENLAHWSATPPAVIAHLLKQPMVLRTPQLKILVKRHPNCPSSAR
jgi:hypothetical protein